MDFTLGDVLIVVAPAAILGMVIWALNHAFKPRNFGISDAERYQRELAKRSAAYQAEQARAALAARERINASTLPSQNQEQARQQSESRQLSPEFVRQLQSMARSGQKIQAIKLLRDYTHADLPSAKNYIDRL